MKAGRGVDASPVVANQLPLLAERGGSEVEQVVRAAWKSSSRSATRLTYALFVCHYIARMERMDEYAVLGSRRMDCIGRVVTRPSDWEDRESTT